MPKKRKPESRSKTNPRARTPRRATSHDGTSLFKGIVVASVIGGTFALGLTLGHGEPRAESDEAKGTLLAIADEQTNRYEAVKSSLKLTFHETLTAPVALAVPAPTEVRPSMKKPVVEKPRAAAEPPPTAQKASAPVAARAEPAAADAEPNDDAVDTAAPALDDDDDGARRARLAKALSRLNDDMPTRVAPEKVEPREEKAIRYLVQVASSPSEENARALADKLRASGRRVRVQAAEIDGQGTMYRVQVTGFSSSEAAAEAQKDLADDGVRGLVRQDT